MFDEYLHFWRLKSSKLPKFIAPKMAKTAVLEVLYSPNLISRNLWMTKKMKFAYCESGKSWNVHIAHCGQFRTFLPLRFYVKSVWSFWSPQNYHLNYFSSSEFWIFGNFSIFSSVKFPKVKILSLKYAWNGSFWLSDISQNWFHVKSALRNSPL